MNITYKMCIRDRGRTTMMVVAVTLHNIPEGMAVGVMYAGFLAGNTQITAASAPVPVSYTHLDVYKRQRLYFVLKSRETSCFIRYPYLLNAANTFRMAIRFPF